MISNHTSGAYAPPAPSCAARSVAVASTAHFSGQIVIPDGETGRIVLAESHLEFSWIMSLLANPHVETIVEQVPFEYLNPFDKAATKYFDFVVSMNDGRKLACEVKPTVRLKSGRVIAELRHIARQTEGHFDEVRLLTEKGLDRIALFNAEMFFGMSEVDRDADVLAAASVDALVGSATLGEMTRALEFGARGFRAIVRQISSRRLRLCRHERLSHTAVVRKGA
ncbi:MAG: hypothetical protein ACN4EU_14525 [Brevundimonas mediterranea]